MAQSTAKSLLAKMTIAAAAGFLLGLLATVIWFRQPGETLTAKNLTWAKRAWHDAAIDAYRLVYRLHGDHYEITTDRNGIVQEATVNGHPPRNADLRQYTMNGLFDLLELELENLTDPNGPFGENAKTVITRVRFHPTLGYLEHYVRSSGGMGRGASIEVIALEPIDAPAGGP